MTSVPTYSVTRGDSAKPYAYDDHPKVGVNILVPFNTFSFKEYTKYGFIIDARK